MKIAVISDIHGNLFALESVLKDIGFKYKESSIIVQALKALGKENITDNIIKQMQGYLEPKLYEKILNDTKTTTTWIYESIKTICEMKRDI